MTVVETRQKLSEPHQYRVGDKEKGIKKRNTLKKERWKYFPKEMGLTLKKKIIMNIKYLLFAKH